MQITTWALWRRARLDHWKSFLKIVRSIRTEDFQFHWTIRSAHSWDDFKMRKPVANKYFNTAVWFCGLKMARNQPWLTEFKNPALDPYFRRHTSLTWLSRAQKYAPKWFIRLSISEDVKNLLFEQGFQTQYDSCSSLVLVFLRCKLIIFFTECFFTFAVWIAGLRSPPSREASSRWFPATDCRWRFSSTRRRRFPITNAEPEKPCPGCRKPNSRNGVEFVCHAW